MSLNDAVLLTTGDAAKLAGRQAATVRWAAKLGKLVPAVVTPSGVRLYRPADVLEWVRTADVNRRRTRRAS